MSVAVSVVIPVYKTSPIVISDALESCLNQTIDEHEIILVNNNASQEALVAIDPYVRRHPKRVRLVHEHRQGTCSARNRGILEARGRYVALLDHDDIMYPRRLQAQLSSAEKHPEASLIHALFDRVTPDNRHILVKGASGTPEFWRKLLFDPASPLANAPTVPPSVMFFKRETAIKAHLFNEQFNPQWVEDTEFCLKMSEQGPFVLVDESLVRWRVQPHADVRERNKSDIYVKLRNLDRMYRILQRKYGSKQNRNAERALRRMRAQWLREASFLVSPFRSGKHIAKYLVLRSLIENPLDAKTWKVWMRAWYPSVLWPWAFHFDEWIDEALPENLNWDFLHGIFRAGQDPFEVEASS